LRSAYQKQRAALHDGGIYAEGRQRIL